MADIDLVPKEYRKRRKRGIGFLSKSVGILLVLLVLSLLLYGGLLLYQSKFQEKLDKIKYEIEVLRLKRDPSTEGAIVELDESIKVLKELFKNHFYWSKLFAKIEEVTLPQVYFSRAAFSPPESEEEAVNISVSGNALSYIVLARQMVSFQEDPLIKKVHISGVSLNKGGGVDFELDVIFYKDILLEEAKE